VECENFELIQVINPIKELLSLTVRIEMLFNFFKCPHLPRVRVCCLLWV